MDRQDAREVAVLLIRSQGALNLTKEKLCQRLEIPVGSFELVIGQSFTEFLEDLVTDGGLTLEMESAPVDRKRMHPQLRKEQIIQAALEVATEVGYSNLTRKILADRIEVSPATIQRYYPTIPQLKRAVMRAAIKHERLPVIAQGLVVKDPHAMKASGVLKAQASAWMVQ